MSINNIEVAASLSSGVLIKPIVKLAATSILFIDINKYLRII